MSSQVLARASGPSKPNHPASHQARQPLTRGKKVVIIVGAVVLALGALLASRIWPFSEESVVQDLAEASDSAVSVRAFRRIYFPFPGCVLDGVVFRHGPQKFTLITIDKLTIAGSYFGILRRHVPRITAEGGHVFIPPFGSNQVFHSQHSDIVVEEIVANGTIVDFMPDNPKKRPLRFDVHEALLNDVRWGHPITYRLKFHNPEPPGEISARGKFGAWTTGRPGDTPISGEYAFEHADLGVYGGIAGMLASRGKFDGVLQHINIEGATETPDFEVRSSGHRVKLQTSFNAFVDATKGNTFLNRVDAHFGRTVLVAHGSVAGEEHKKGKAAKLELTAQRGRIEDILGLFVTEPRSPMSGAVALQAHAEIPPGNQEFLERVKLRGTFGIEGGSFSKAETQKNVDELSAGARGENKDDPETVLTDLRGQVVLEGGVARFSDISFGVPGAAARMRGTYNILNHKIDLHGTMRVDTKISKTASGVKALLLKVMDPIFKKKKKGEVVPVHIAGTYEHPQFGLDISKSGIDEPPRK